jgi:hypothetical protein
MTIRKILTRAIKKAGGDGLCNPHAECGCGLDNLFICEMFDIDECVIAKKTPCKNCSIVDDYCYMPIESKEDEHPLTSKIKHSCDNYFIEGKFYKVNLKHLNAGDDIVCAISGRNKIDRISYSKDGHRLIHAGGGPPFTIGGKRIGGYDHPIIFETEEQRDAIKRHLINNGIWYNLKQRS